MQLVIVSQFKKGGTKRAEFGIANKIGRQAAEEWIEVLEDKKSQIEEVRIGVIIFSVLTPHKGTFKEMMAKCRFYIAQCEE